VVERPIEICFDVIVIKFIFFIVPFDYFFVNIN
jgi:hypothetical protein